MFKDRLKKLRLGKGMTQEQLAEKLDLPPSTIRRYESMERGFPKEERLQVIADFFLCTVDYLLGREESKKPTVSDLELSDDELIKKYNVVLDGKPIPEDILREILSYVRVRRSQK